jgi:ribulose 1,5-bisphosphate carboxylase large subunit-like protein
MENLDCLGINCIIQTGGAMHGHHDASTARARAMVQAINAWKMQIL